MKRSSGKPTLDREQWEHPGEPIPRQRVGARGTGDDAPVVGVGGVLDGADEDAQVPPREGDDGRGGTGPRNVLAGGPGEPEQADGQADAADHGRVEAVLRRHLVRRVFGGLLPVDEGVAEDDSDETEDAADDDGEEDEAGLLEGEVVHPPEGVGDGGEEAEEGAELGGDVEGDEADDGLEEEHADGADEGDEDEHL